MRMDLWANSVLDSQDKHEAQTIKSVNNIDRNNTDDGEITRDLLEIIYTGLEDSYKIGKECLKKEYNIIDNTTPNVSLIKSLTYHKDGKTLDKRVSEYIKDFIDKTTNASAAEIAFAKKELITKILRIQNTESMCVFNNTLVFIAKKHGYTGYKIISIGTCTSHSVNCNDKNGKEYDISNLDNLPPFHTNCKCTIELIKEGE